MIKFINIGLDNYAAAVDPLKGCVNDAKNWYNLLINNCFIPYSEPLLNEFARRDNILDSLDEFILDLSENDLGIITYSGHGTLVERNGNLIDEAIYAYEGKIVAEKLEKRLNNLNTEAKLVFFIDACYSENIINGTYIEKMRIIINKMIFRIRKLNSNFKESKDRVRFHSSINITNNSSKRKLIETIKNSNSRKIFLYTSCKENQKSYEREFEDGETKGVFSHYAQKILADENYNNYTYESFSNRIKQEMSSELKQTPDEKLVKSLKETQLFS